VRTTKRKAVTMMLCMSASVVGVANCAGAGEGPLLLEGFAKASAWAYKFDNYANHRGGCPTYLAYSKAPAWDKKPPEQVVEWSTSPVPTKQAVVFVFVGLNGEDPGEMLLSVDGKQVLSFGSGINHDMIWRRGDWSLAFHYVDYTLGNSGVYYLSVPAKHVTAGKPCTLRVVPAKGGKDKAWFMVAAHKDNLAAGPKQGHRAVLAGLLAKARSEASGKDAGRLGRLPRDKHAIVSINPPWAIEGNTLLAGSGRGKVGTVAGPGGCAVAKSILRLSGKKTSVVTLDRKLAAGELPELTVQAWVRVLPGEASGRRVVVQAPGRFELSVHYGRLEGTLHLAGGRFNKYARGSVILDDGRWHLISMTYDGYLLQLFADGQLQLAYPVSGEIVKEDANILLGSAKAPFQGWIGSVEIANAARPLRQW